MIDPRNSQEKEEIGAAVALEQPALPQPEEHASDHETNTEMQDGAVAETAATTPVEPPTSGKKRVKKAQPSEEELMPHPSIWPFILALSIAVLLGGFAFQTIVLVIGVIMVITSVIGWNLERR